MCGAFLFIASNACPKPGSVLTTANVLFSLLYLARDPLNGRGFEFGVITNVDLGSKFLSDDDFPLPDAPTTNINFPIFLNFMFSYLFYLV